MKNRDGLDESKAFFDRRAAEVQGLELTALCYVSGRDPRLWANEQLYCDLIESILKQSQASRELSMLEVGCASGFLAKGLASRVGNYTGVDVAPNAVRMARRLALPNAEFCVADGRRLPFAADRFDVAICYDVFINLSSFELGEAIISEMLRVVKRGGRVLIGSIPDGAKRAESEQKVVEVGRNLDFRFGPSPDVAVNRAVRWRERIGRLLKRVEPRITCYYFDRQDFLQLGKRLGVDVELVDIHPMNPYVGVRFNAVFLKGGI